MFTQNGASAGGVGVLERRPTEPGVGHPEALSPACNEPVLNRKRRPETDAPTPLRHVALLIETTGAYGRGLLQGVAKYNREHGRWSTYFRPHALTDAPPAWMKNWRGDGLIVRIETQQMLDVVRSLNVPTVNLRNTLPGVKYPYVGVDHARVAQLAYQHLTERGLRTLAWCGRPRCQSNPALELRGEAFRALAESAGIPCHMYPASARLNAKEDWEAEQGRISAWLAKLPRPVGVFACNDERGIAVLDACRRINARVPDEIAVIGVDNDEALCDLAIPPLTSIDVNAEGIGYHAAALLDGMMNGEKAAGEEIRLAPRAVVTRRSTDVIASEDEDVSRAVRYIREHACRGLQAGDVLDYMGMSRSTLQERMKQYTGRTIHREIQRVRMSRAKELLAMSDMTIKQIARESGFGSVQYLTRVFRAMTGETPAGYRNRRQAQ
jgi:LacI family transcriptional regulator